MIVYPAIDVLGGQCVRLTEGDYSQVKTYNANPADVARRFYDQGATHLHVVDLDGAKEGRPVNLKTIQEILKAAPLKVQIGGGIRNAAAVSQWLEAGADRAVMGTALTKDRNVTASLFQQFGPKLVAGVDTKAGMVAVSGWIETSTLKGEDFVRDLASLGCKTVVFTDVARDGRLEGPNLEATAQMVKAVPLVDIVASGGVASLRDLIALKGTGCAAAIVGKALYEGRFNLADAMSATN